MGTVMGRPRKHATHGDLTRAVAYLRVSTEEQHLGPEAQRAQIVAWATREGVDVLSWHVDQGVSGSTLPAERPQLNAALDAVRATGAGRFVVAKRDRLARDVTIAVAIEKLALARGARVVAADGAGNGDSPADAFLRTILDGSAAYELGVIRARTVAALGVKRARGERTGGVPYGFREGEGGVLLPEPRERETVARMRALRAEGRTLAGIAQTLAAEGYANRAGHLFDLGWISRVLRTPSRWDDAPDGAAS
jgi:DNA invertase Pin-like site-specific DNA recombinase